MRERKPELTSLDLQVFIVTFESAASVDRFRKRHDIPWPLLRDPRRVAYRTFGMERDPLRALAAPRTGWYYVRQARRGRLPRMTVSDYAQLGGDVLLSPDGEVCWSHISREPADRAPVERIVRKTRDCAGG